MTLVVSHDPPLHIKNTLTLDAALSFLFQTDLELFVEISVVIEKLVSSNVADRSVVFGFAAVARSFSWESARPVRLGVIVMCPWNLNRAVRAYAPNVLFLGWDMRVWTRIAFRTWWSVFSLERHQKRHQLPLLVGIAQRLDDLNWLSQQQIYGVVVDINRTIAAGLKAAQGWHPASPGGID
jgi:hypothetical protein